MSELGRKGEAKFVRKAVNKDNYYEWLDKDLFSLEEVIVVDEVYLSDEEFNEFIENLLESKNFLCGKGGVADGYTKVVYVVNEDNFKENVLVNPEGYDFARYVAFEFELY